MKQIQLALFLLMGLLVSGQEFHLGKVSRAELEQKFHPADTSAPAAILYKKGLTYFMVNTDGYFSMVTEVECRIKIYKKEGYRYATDKLTYYTGGKTIKAFYSDAYTYNLVNGKVEKTRLKGEGEFKEKVEENFSQRVIAMPNVKEGSVIEFKYTIITPYFTVFRDWYFQYDIPADYVSYEVAIPQYFAYNRFLNGFVKVDQAKTKVRPGSGGNFNESVDVYTAKNVKAIKEESYVNNIRNYTSILMHELASTNFPSGREEYATSWETVTERIYDDEDFGKELEYTSYFKDDLVLLINPSASQAEKTEIIFSYVKNRMNWDGEASYYCEKGVKKAYDDKVGNSAEINLMLTTMLRKAGVPANPVLVSTRSNGVAVFPNRAAYNYVIAGIEIGEKILLLDATSKYTTNDILPLRALNWMGRMIRQDGTSIEVDLMPKANSRKMVNITAQLTPDGKVSGNAGVQYSEYNAYMFREKYAGMTDEGRSQQLETQYKSMEVTDYRMENETDVAKPVGEKYSFIYENGADVVGYKIYLNPMLYLADRQSPFSQETREYPVDFGFPYQDRYVFTISIPNDYSIESLPAPLALTMEHNIGTFKYNSVVRGNMIQLAVSLDINYANVSQEFYPTIRDFFKKMAEKHNEKIVLKKA